MPDPDDNEGSPPHVLQAYKRQTSANSKSKKGLFGRK